MREIFKDYSPAPSERAIIAAALTEYFEAQFTYLTAIEQQNQQNQQTAKLKMAAAQGKIDNAFRMLERNMQIHNFSGDRLKQASTKVMATLIKKAEETANNTHPEREELLLRITTMKIKSGGYTQIHFPETLAPKIPQSSGTPPENPRSR